MKHNIITTLFLLLFLNLTGFANEEKTMLQEWINNVDGIHSATYFSTRLGYAPGDSIPSIVNERFVRMLSNPNDAFLKSSFVCFDGNDSTKANYYYDGNIRVRINQKEGTYEVDDFKSNTLPFRVIDPPFFIKAKAILSFCIQDNLKKSVVIEDHGDSLLLKLIVFDKIVEFIGSYIDIRNGEEYLPPICSKYEIWFHKTDNLPYCIKREMPHDVSLEYCRNLRINGFESLGFDIQKYLSNGFNELEENPKIVSVPDLLNCPAPDWALKDIDGNLFSLAGFNSKVLLIQFSSISCGPCQISVGFMKQLSVEYDYEDFELLAFESWNPNPAALRSYVTRNQIGYKFLISSVSVSKAYQIQAVPVFFVLDENRIVRKIIRGYSKGKTDNEIRSSINALLQ